MAATVLGKIKSAKGKLYEVKWDEHDKNIYVDGTLIGKASSVKEAMYKAEAWVITNK